MIRTDTIEYAKALEVSGELREAAEIYESIAESSGKEHLYDRAGTLYIQAGDKERGEQAIDKAEEIRNKRRLRSAKDYLEIGRQTLNPRYFRKAKLNAIFAGKDHTARRIERLEMQVSRNHFGRLLRIVLS